jgi:hypothetical protein
MKLGIIGEPYAGKTTLLELLRAEPGKPDKYRANMTVVKVSDERVEYLAKGHHIEKMVFPELCFVDIQEGKAGGVAGVVPDIREMDALIIVLRTFETPHVPSPPKGIDPLRDLKRLETELQLADLIVVEKRLERLKKEHAKGLEPDTLQKAQEILNSGKPLRQEQWSLEETKIMAGFKFVSLMPLLVVINISEEGYLNNRKKELIEFICVQQLPWLELCCIWEKEIAGLPPEEQIEFSKELGLEVSGPKKVIQACYDLLQLISFITVGEHEVRAWAIKAGTTVLEAAGQVHSDMQRGFIRAEVLNYTRLRELGMNSFSEAKKKGEIRLEGKEYLVKDGDIIYFRFHV